MANQKYFMVTVTAPVNIAVIKYWGKRDEHLILPLNDSISFTLSQSQLCATTTACISPAFAQDAFWLNGKEESLENPRIQNCLKEIRSRGKKRLADGSISSEDLTSWRVHICSSNNFPTAAGLASSAAGYAAMVVAVAEVYGVTSCDLSVAARQGSGSACRSVLGGMVRWYKGELPDGSDSVARQIAPPDHWGDLHVLLCVASGRRKKTGSTEGMRRCVKTSQIMNYRITKSVERRIVCITQAIADKDWSRFCDLTMADSNEMHASCLDAFPPCVYMNDASHAVAALVHDYNTAMLEESRAELKICYTFDAGPNPCLFVPNAAVGQVVSLLLKVFPPSEHCTLDTFLRGLACPTPSLTPQLETVGNDFLSTYHNTSTPRLQYVLHTTVGDGPHVLATACHSNPLAGNNNSVANSSNGDEGVAISAACTAKVSAAVANGSAAGTSSGKGNTGGAAAAASAPSSCHLIDPLTGNPVFSPPVS